MQVKVSGTGGMGGEHKAAAHRLEDALETEADSGRPTLLYLHVARTASVPLSQGNGPTYGGRGHVFQGGHVQGPPACQTWSKADEQAQLDKLREEVSGEKVRVQELSSEKERLGQQVIRLKAELASS